MASFSTPRLSPPKGVTAGSARAFALAVALGVACVARKDPFSTTSSLGLSGAAGPVVGILGAVLLTPIVVFCNHLLRARTGFGRRLADDLATRTAGTSLGAVLLVAASTSIAEELIFRGVLVPWCGVLLSSAAFGALHFRAGLAWSCVAALFGASLGVLFVLTGSLAGPLLAHFAVDVVALATARNARERDSQSVRVPLRGLLGAAAKLR